MFEDNQNQQNLTNQNIPASPPPNLPVEGAELANQAEDILADVDVAPANTTSGPKSSPPLGIGGLPPAVPPPSPVERAEPFFKRYQKVIVFLLILVVGGGVLGAGGWYAYTNFFNQGPAQPALNVNQPTVNQNTPINQNINQPTVNQNTPINQNINQPAVNQNANTNQPPADTDRDGITDQEEALYGTDPNSADSDNDGLTDRDEIKVFKTDPTNEDTDGDGFIDGEEVRNGFDPKGEGRLLEIQ